MTERLITRVVIAFDSVGDDQATIASAAPLAAWLDVALHGVFVEDEALLNLAAMPFARHIGAGGEIFDTVDERAMLHQFDAHAIRIRAALEAAARAHAVGWSFDVVRGPSTVATIAIGEQDLLVIEAESRPFAGGLRLDSRWLASALKTPYSILLSRGSSHALQEVVVLVQTTSAAATRLIRTAATVAARGRQSLRLLLAAVGCDEAAALDIVRSVSPALAASSRVERIAESPAALERAATFGRLLAVDATPNVNTPDSLREIVARTRSDILLLR